MRVRLAACLLLAVFSSSCASAGGAGGQSTPLQQRKPNPVNVTEHLDTAHSVQSVLDATGGMLTATGADGVTFNLTIPPGALVLSTLVRMTPVASLDGLPWHGGFLAAVHIQPDGTPLAKPALLSISGTRATTAGAAVTGFMYEGAGTDFHLYPSDPKQVGQFHVVHFSSPGLGGASPQDLASQIQQTPASTLAELEQDVSAAIERLGQGANPGQIVTEVQKLFDDFGKDVLGPEINVGIRSPSAARYEQFWQAFLDLQAAERLAELQNLQIANYRQLLDKWLAALPKMAKALVNACFAEHDVQSGIRAVYTLRWAALAGIEVPGEPDAAFRCLTFKLDFETDLQSQLPQANAHSHLTATGAVISFLGGGAAPLQYLSFEFKTSVSIPLCTVRLSTRIDQDFAAIGIGGMDLDDELGKRAVLTDFFVNVKPGKAVETITQSCPNPIGTISTNGTYYNSNWENLHQDEHIEHAGYTTIYGTTIPPTDSYAISGWNVHNGSALFADKTYNRTAHYADVVVTEMTTFKLWHAPEGAAVP